MFKRVDPSEIKTKELHQYLVGSVAPRPIAFASTVDENGVPNLAPYSFFNVFGSKPPTLVFSSNRRVSNNTTKDTLSNAEKTGEVVINIVSHEIVRQMALCSVDYDSSISEFSKAGLTPIDSDLVAPKRVAESPVQFECKVKQILPLGSEGGAGNLIICEVVLIHLNEKIFDENGAIDPGLIDQVGRMGRAFYSRPSKSFFKLFQPVSEIGIGFDQLPSSALQSGLTGNELGELAALTAVPEPFSQGEDDKWEDLTGGDDHSEFYLYVKKLIAEGENELALRYLVSLESYLNK